MRNQRTGRDAPATKGGPAFAEPHCCTCSRSGLPERPPRATGHHHFPTNEVDAKPQPGRLSRPEGSRKVIRLRHGCKPQTGDFWFSFPVAAASHPQQDPNTRTRSTQPSASALNRRNPALLQRFGCHGSWPVAPLRSLHVRVLPTRLRKALGRTRSADRGPRDATQERATRRRGRSRLACRKADRRHRFAPSQARVGTQGDLRQAHALADGASGSTSAAAPDPRLRRHDLPRLHRVARGSPLRRRPRDGHRLRADRPAQGDGRRAPERQGDQREDRVPLRVRPPGGLSQGARQDEARGQVRRTDRHAGRHPRARIRAWVPSSEGRPRPSPSTCWR